MKHLYKLVKLRVLSYLSLGLCLAVVFAIHPSFAAEEETLPISDFPYYSSVKEESHKDMILKIEYGKSHSHLEPIPISISQRR